MNKLLKIISKYRINILVITISFSACIIYYIIFTTYRSILYFDWDIITPKYQEIDEVFLHDLRYGQDFVIMKYDKLDKLINYDDYKVILNNNVNDIQKIINRYYDMLDEQEKEKFDEKVDIKYLLKKGNYFLYKNESTCIREEYILIIVCKNNDVYIMSSCETDGSLGHLCVPDEYWKVDFPDSYLEKKEVYFCDDNYIGQGFGIFEYDNNTEVIEKLNMSEVTEDNQKEVKSKIDNYYKRLNKNKKNMFDNEVELKDLYSIGNYYLYIEQDDLRERYAIFILCENNKLYVLTNT